MPKKKKLGRKKGVSKVLSRLKVFPGFDDPRELHIWCQERFIDAFRESVKGTHDQGGFGMSFLESELLNGVLPRRVNYVLGKYDVFYFLITEEKPDCIDDALGMDLRKIKILGEKDKDIEGAFRFERPLCECCKARLSK